uniref:NADH-ubiquinone oxidoreductase chain 5 n=1 Tax=Paroedura masobe TaxID=347812 RepID=A0A7R7G1Q9_9SAUR|nr:NADH dehydrogenase subunit 5 [Paroedura masobe]
MVSLLFHTSIILTLAVLISPLFVRALQHKAGVLRTTKLATVLSLIPTMIFINFGIKTITTTITWAPAEFDLQVSFTFDLYTLLFLPTGLFITWAILQFTCWYMNDDPQKNKFSTYLLMFLTAMLILISANNLFQLFIGWEGVGVMSFLLINWWAARTDANTSALQAIIYNRIGDMGLILSLAWAAMNLNTWNFQQMLSHPMTPAVPLLGLILAAAGKSAQFGLHPWLPSAMEGPTPVSALLHSSTMVVAGVFLLVRFSPMLQQSEAATTTCLALGSTTTAFTALCALAQNDIKKIIAFSTSSQLGLMVLSVGMGQPELAFLHIITHAFFKAMLFLCSGSIIHAMNNEQDIRKMGGVQQTLPITTACLTLGSLALAGFPFLAGFYTKDLIVETICTSTINAWALCTALLATALTAAYSMRLSYYVQLGQPRHPPDHHLSEADQNQTQPIIRLGIGSIVAGLVIMNIVLPNKPHHMTMLPHMKLAALLVTLLGLMCTLDLLNKPAFMTQHKNSWPHTTLTQLGFFNLFFHRALPHKNLAMACTIALQLKDQAWYELIAPGTLKNLNITASKTTTSATTGKIKTHLTTFALLLSTCMLTHYIDTH